jgi:agmatine deiminase
VLEQVGVNLKRIEFFRSPTNRGWTRDSGPIFVKRKTGRRETAIVKFRFNAWARYPDWRKDATVPEKAARALRKRMFEAWVGEGKQRRMLVLEGGGVDVNGRGSLLTTEEWLLDQKTQARNPGMSRREAESALLEYLGATNVMWLGRGIAGDDTHGHVDDLCRFVNPRTVVLCREKNPRDANYRTLAENWERVRGLRLENGSRVNAVPLPMPAPLIFAGQRLPASYANFYICIAAVIVPTFNDPNDRVALGTLAELFRDRPVIGIHAVDLVWGLGTLHCLTQQQPAEG